MLDAIRRFVSELAGTPPHARLRPADHRLAAAALLYHVAALDGAVDHAERSRLSALLMTEFSLGEADSEELIDDAAEADREAVDLYGFTSLLKSHLDDEGRRNIIGLMWQMAYADGVVGDLQENVVWRVAELLGVSGRDRMILKKVAQERG